MRPAAFDDLNFQFCQHPQQLVFAQEKDNNEQLDRDSWSLICLRRHHLAFCKGRGSPAITTGKVTR